MFKKLLLIVVSGIIVIGSAWYFCWHWQTYSSSYAPIGTVVTQKVLFDDIRKMAYKEQEQYYIEIVDNSIEQSNYQKYVFFDNDKRASGKFIHLNLKNKINTDSADPREVRMIIRVMLYLKERKLDSSIEPILGVAGAFVRDEFTSLSESQQLVKMSMAEFNELYNALNVSNLDTEKQVDILTQKWIEKTGYWRRGMIKITESKGN